MMRTMRFGLVLCVAALVIGPSCTLDPVSKNEVRAIFVAPSSLADLVDEHYFDHPWPSDFRRDADGTIHVAGLPNPSLNPVVSSYVASTQGMLDGFSPTATAYFRFEGDLDTKTLPVSPTDALSPRSSVQMVDIDPASPERGHRKLIEWFWRPEAGLYWSPHTLAIAPAHGYPLRSHTRYALVVTRSASAVNGGRLVPSDDLAEVMGFGPQTSRTVAVRDAFRGALADLARDNVPTSEIVQLTVFTTNDPAQELFRVADQLPAVIAAPTVDPVSWKAKEQKFDYDVYEGSYGPAPNFQAGNLPFAQLGDGGGFVFDPAGKPIVQSTFSMRFTMVVPKASACPQPPTGYPIVLYAHGTGGDYRSIVAEGHSVGQSLAQQCLASMGVDQIFHGARPGAPPMSEPAAQRESEIQLLFFNLLNPLAARSNGRQSAIDVIQQARLFTDTHTIVPATNANGPVSRTGTDIEFDSGRLLFVGHSQGGVNGPLFLAADSKARGGVLSGTGGMITVALLEKTAPPPSVAGAVRALLGLSSHDYDDELNLFHPIINLAQMIVDATDPINYMPYIIQHPRAGFPPKSIYQTEGIGPDGVGDSYAPPHGIEYASVALGLPRQLPGVRDIPQDAWGQISAVAIPSDGLSGNLANGLASGVLAQFPPAAGSDGHFVLFDVPQARAQASVFCKNLAADPKGRVPAIQ